MIGFEAVLDCGLPQFSQIPAVHGKATAGGARPLAFAGGIGTGGIENAHFIRSRQGYSLYATIADSQHEPVKLSSAELMQIVQKGFGRTMSHLPVVFGVSRQTLYNWLGGEVPKEKHHDKLRQLAAAAQVFSEQGFQPTALALSRTVEAGSSFTTLIGEGADGRVTAEKLIKIVQLGNESKRKLDVLLGNRKLPPLDIDEIGYRAFDEAI